MTEMTITPKEILKGLEKSKEAGLKVPPSPWNAAFVVNNFIAGWYEDKIDQPTRPKS